MTAALAAVALSGCAGGAQDSSNLFVKDALTDDVSAVHVTFTKAQAKAADGGWITVFEGKETIELLSLSAADAKERLASFTLAPGQYESLRIAVSEVEITYLNGTKDLLNVFGNVVLVADDFTVGADGIDILVDFDLEAGVDLDAGTYTPVVARVQTSDDDHDGDGMDDVDDVDDDADGLRDDEDDDEDGNGEDDEPWQQHAGSEETTCELGRDEELADANMERDEELAEAAAERDDVLEDANSTQQDRDDAWILYNATAEQVGAEHELEVTEAEKEYGECLTEEGDENRPEDEEQAGSDEEDDGESTGEDESTETDGPRPAGT